MRAHLWTVLLLCVCPALVSAERVPSEAPACGGQVVPMGWPDFSDETEALLAPFLSCTSPGELVALQDRVEMPRLLESLDDWGAVRLGALGPVREDSAQILQHKRASFLVNITERYGVFHAEVFALYLLHSAYDDEVDELLLLLARDKQLGQTLALMPAVREELEGRGRPLSRYSDRAEQAGDVLRGLGRAARDTLLTSPTIDGLRYTEMAARRAQLPPPYQQALHEVERALARGHLAPGSVAVGTFDAVTFGVPLGFHYLVSGMGHGVYSLTQGEYEQATRELSPVAVMSLLYVQGKGPPLLSRNRVAIGPANGLEALRAHVGALERKTRQLGERLGTGMEGLRELARHIQASRAAGRFVAVGGEHAALALHAARGDVARARPLMSRWEPTPPTKAGTGGHVREASALADETARRATLEAREIGSPSTLASLVNTEVGHTPQVLAVKLVAAELEASGPRLSKDVAILERHIPALDAPPFEARGNPRWREYVDYYEKRLSELRASTAAEGPLQWEPYERMRAWFTRGMAFERDMVKRLRSEAEKPRAQRGLLADFDKPRIEIQVGVRKPGPGLRYADVLVIEEGEPGRGPRRVESFSFKSRALAQLEERERSRAEVWRDARHSPSWT